MFDATCFFVINVTLINVVSLKITGFSDNAAATHNRTQAVNKSQVCHAPAPSGIADSTRSSALIAPMNVAISSIWQESIGAPK